jgi:3-dehydrosphinganine reductase
MALGLFWATVSLVVFLTVITLDMLGYLKGKNRFDVNGRVRDINAFLGTPY